MPLIPLHQTVGALFPGLSPPAPQTYAAWPVWRDSTTKEVKFQPMPKRQAVKLWHDARRFERQTRQPGFQDGAIGRSGLAVLQALLFDFLNYASGALYPSWEAIADKACISPRSVGRGLAKFKAAGVLNWLRCCVEDWIDGRFTLRQETNAYARCCRARNGRATVRLDRLGGHCGARGRGPLGPRRSAGERSQR
jgi:hypothetical protein